MSGRIGRHAWGDVKPWTWKDCLLFLTLFWGGCIIGIGGAFGLVALLFFAVVWAL